MSTRYNTQNPIESDDVRDMSDNAKNLDLFSNSSELSFDDRLGIERKTIHGMNSEFDGMIVGMNSEFDAQILNIGFTRVGTFLSGATLTNPRQTLLWDIADGGDGQEYGWSGTFPKIVPLSSTPSSTGGIAVGAWMSRFDPEMRGQVREAMRRSYAEAGYNLVDGSFEVGGTLVNTNDVLLQERTGKAYSGPAGTVAAGTDPTVGGSGYTDQSQNQSLVVVDSVQEVKSGHFTLGSLVMTRGYYKIGDGGGKIYFIRGRIGGYGQNNNVIIPCNADEAQAHPTDAILDATHAGILPSVSDSDNTMRFNDLAAIAFGRGQKIIDVPFKADYLCTGELTGLAKVTFVGAGKIVGGVENNYYKRIYPKECFAEQVTVNNSNGENFSNFRAAIKRYKEGGASPVIVVVGDSLVQGGHRATDNFWFVKNLEKQLKERFGGVVIHNRGIAGSEIGQLDAIVQTSTAINAPYEQPWNNVPNKLLREYVRDLNPDLIIIAYGMNSGNAGSSSHAIVTARKNLKTISPSADIAWVTTPIRTTDLTATNGGTMFGTYPGNEYSNTAGLVTRHLAGTWGDYCIDVNRMSAITHLGEDPINFRMNRYAGQYRTPEATLTNPAVIVVESDGSWTVDMGQSGSTQTLEMFRNVSVEFTVNSSTIFSPDFRVSLRDDPSSPSELLLQFLPDSINLIGYGYSFGVQATWTVSTSGKKFRIEAIGADVALYIDDVLTQPSSGNSTNLYGSMFLAPVKILATQATSVVLNNFIVSGATRYDYAAHVPTITAYEAFNVAVGDGGNNLNHPNTLGEREMYSQPISEFVGYLSSVSYDLNLVSELTLTPVGSSGFVKLVRYADVISILFEDFSFASNDGATPIFTLPGNLSPRQTTSFCIAAVNADSTTKRVQVRQNGQVYISGGGTGSVVFAGSVCYIA